jgi:hypothetical protein
MSLGRSPAQAVTVEKVINRMKNAVNPVAINLTQSPIAIRLAHLTYKTGN